MKRLYVLTCMMYLACYQAFSQVHAGGKADGYASAELKLKEVAGLQDDLQNNALVSPNPAKSGEIITIKGLENVQKIYWVDVATLHQTEIAFARQNNAWVLASDNLPQGVYLLYIVTQESFRIIKKILIHP